MKSAFFVLLLAVSPVHAADVDFDPAKVSLSDALTCKLDVPSYNGFAIAVAEDGGLAAQRHWVKIKNNNPFLSEYEMPGPIQIAGYATRRIAFSSSGILAVLDEPNPEVIAKPEGIKNQMDPEPLIASIVAEGKATRAQIDATMRDEVTFHKFLGEKVIADHTELPQKGESFGAHSKIALSVSNVTSHPGKTLYGCSYTMEMLDSEGKPL